ncbi:hypothetical protein CC80DRAFT_260533 [Byssothecium circinans]|uniref:RlpA-like protein double-psi beta-barrel domain-containing protein n=1 Tax=Byssothecium circinans TaxID=147558 RepID=A0A6A5U7A9_9PLEO|nr:hypothetical protein CC80DRAFT_260533 [Byssothecium circinans]
MAQKHKSPFISARLIFFSFFGSILAVPSDKRDDHSYAGDLTFYSPGLGACGQHSGPGEAVVAISHYTFDPNTPDGNPNHNKLCGKMMRITKDGRSVDVQVVDRCEGCQERDVDVPIPIFQQLADPTLGRVPVTWVWL